jgi:hypothetical protein
MPTDRKKKSSFMQSLSIHHGPAGIQEYLCPWVFSVTLGFYKTIMFQQMISPSTLI